MDINLWFSFLDNIDRISEQNFTPNDDDLLRVRIPTTGIVQEDFEFSHVRLRYEYIVIKKFIYLNKLELLMLVDKKQSDENGFIVSM
jgi:hypothetical protein